MKKYLILFCTLLITTSLFAQKKLTLDEAISIALQRNSGLIQSQNNLEYSKSSLKSAWGNLLPTVGMNGSWSWSRTEDIGGSQIDYLGNPIIVPPTKSDTRSYQLSAGGGITLFNGLANYASISQAGDNLDAAEFNLSKLKQDVVLQTTELFYGIANAKAMLDVRIDNVTYNQKFLETVQERNRLGAVAIADVYAQQVQLGNAELLRIQAENAYENAKSTLLNFLALDVLEEYDFVDPIDQSAVENTDQYLNEFDDAQTMVQTALANRHDYKGQQLAVDAAGSGVTIARSGLFPTLSGNYSYSTSALTTDALFDRKVYGVSMTLSVPIFSNWNTEQQIEYSQVQELNAQEQLTALERQIKIEIKQGYLDFVAGKKSLDVSTNNVKWAEENRKMNRERYTLGSGTILELLQADRDFTDALRAKINAQYEFYRLKDRLVNYLGNLDYKIYE
ncbi:TolC family protein [Bacteroidota bacterium]